MPMEQMPILEIDGKVYHQARAISRYLAKQLKLYGSDDLQDMEIDMCVDDLHDLREFYYRYITALYIHEDEPNQKAKLLELAVEKTPWLLAKFEDRIKKNGGFLVGGKLTLADIYFSAMSETLCNLGQKDFIKDYPAMQKLIESVRSHPKIKAYLDKRPKTKY